MERLTDGPATSRATCRPSPARWSNVRGQRRRQLHQCVPASVNRQIERAAQAKLSKSGRQTADLATQAQRLLQLNRTIQSMPEFRRSYDGERNYGENLTRDCLLQRIAPEHQLQKCYWATDAGETTANGTDMCKKLEYEGNKVRFLDERDIKNATRASNSRTSSFQRKKPGEKVPTSICRT